MLKPNPRAYWLVPVAALSLMGCPDEELAPLEPCASSGAANTVTQTSSDKLDLLFVIDNSGSMEQEQEKIKVQLPRLVKILTTGDLGQDGSNKDPGDFEPVGSLHLGVVSVNMGTLGQLDDTVASCKGKGDDGLLLDEVSNAQKSNPDCAGGVDVDKYMTFDTKTADNVAAEAEKVAQDFACISVLGIDGCGLEQQLESMLKALVPRDNTQENANWSPKITFPKGEGHGDDENKGFLRDEAVLAIIHVSDEEDCSVTDKGKELFSQGSDAIYNGPDTSFTGMPVGLNFKCANAVDSPKDPDLKDDTAYEDRLLQPAQRFIDGILQLKPAANKDKIIFAGIVGIPESAETMEKNGAQDFSGILAMPEMKILPGLDASGAKTLDSIPFPACTAANGIDGSASPARRFVQVAQGFGANAILRSICSASYEDALTAILEKISTKLTGACLSSQLNPNSKGVVQCDVTEVLGKDGKPADCDPTRGRKFKEMREVEVAGEKQSRVVCDVNQVAVVRGELTQAPKPLTGVSALAGWYYDHSAEATAACPQGRITTTKGAEPAEGASFGFDCFNPIGGDIEDSGKAAVGAACDPDHSRCKSNDDYKLTCQEDTHTCQITCVAESDCPSGWVCDQKFCVNPKCPPPD
jgi:hypothetical protein